MLKGEVEADGARLLVALAALFVYKKLISRVRMRGPSVDTDAVLGKMLGSGYTEAKFQKQIKRLKQGGSYLAAGRMFEEAQRFPEAVEVYLEGEEYHAAAVNLERLGNIERAAEFYVKGGDHKKAAQILSDAGKHAKAAALFLEKGNTLDAARLFGVAGLWDKAADLYLKGGYPLRAAEAFDKAGHPLKAAECYEKHFMENVSYATTYSATGSSGQEKTARQAGQPHTRASADSTADSSPDRVRPWRSSRPGSCTGPRATPTSGSTSAPTTSATSTSCWIRWSLPRASRASVRRAAPQ